MFGNSFEATIKTILFYENQIDIKRKTAEPSTVVNARFSRYENEVKRFVRGGDDQSAIV